jgi:uncharacterized protein (TIGR03437 family)
MSCVRNSLVVFLLPAVAALSQQPVINPQGVVNAASFASPGQPSSGIVPGSIASLFGQNLAPAPRQAQALPLPRSLEGTSVTVNGIPAPLFYVSPNQINFQVPRGLDRFGGPVPVVVTTAAGPSAPVLADVAYAAIGIFTQESRGCGQGAVQNVASDGSRTLNSPAQSASPSSFVSVYATGLGPVYFAPPDGYPAPRDPLALGQGGARAYLGLEGFARVVPFPTYEGLAPDLVGVYQIDFQVPDDGPEGCAVPLIVTDAIFTSQPVMISVRRGGGQCRDAPPASFASLRWQKTVTTGPQPSVVSTQEAFTATFAEGPENQVQPQPALPEWRCPSPVGPKPGPRCPGMGPRTLDAGPLTLEGLPGGLITVNPASSSGEIVYSASLPVGSIRAGSVRVVAVGGPKVGAFQTGISIPPPIEITTPLPPGTLIPNNQPFRLTWRNGSADAVVCMRLAAPNPVSEPTVSCVAYASDGEVTVGMLSSGDRLYFPLPPSDNAYLVVTVSPRAGQVQSFSAPGLTQGGKHEWSYEYRFYGLRIRSP